MAHNKVMAATIVLPVSNISLKQAVHRGRVLHVRFDSIKDQLLRLRKLKRQTGDELVEQPALHLERNALLFDLPTLLLEFKPQFQQEKFIERQTFSRRLAV